MCGDAIQLQLYALPNVLSVRHRTNRMKIDKPARYALRLAAYGFFMQNVLNRMQVSVLQRTDTVRARF